MKIKATYFLPLLSALLLMSVALFNGFPLVEGDTGSYVSCPLEHIIPKDRTPFYGWFLRLTHMCSSLWYTVFAQCLLVALALHAYIRLLFGGAVQPRITVAAVLLTVAFTAASWVAAFLMPDVFGGILLLLILCYLGHTGSLAGRIVLIAALFGAIAIHNSHFLIVLMFATCLAACALYLRNRTLLRRSGMMATLAFAFYLLMCSINAANGSGFTFAPASHVFMMTKFAETGILKTYLDDNCDKKQLNICPYKNEIPSVSWVFLWDQANSPLYKTGGWEANRAEYNTIIHDVFTTPKYVVKFAEKSASYTLHQFFTISLPDKQPVQLQGTSPYGGMQAHFAHELPELSRSRQNNEGMYGTTANIIYLLFFVLSSAFLLLVPGTTDARTRRIYAAILLFLFINAFVTATFSTVIYRFQYRVFWILPATNIILIIRWLHSRYTQKTSM